MRPTPDARHAIPGTGYHGGEDVTVTEYRHPDKPDIFVIATTYLSEAIALDRGQIQRLYELSQP